MADEIRLEFGDQTVTAVELKSPWVPYAAEIVADWLGRRTEEIKERYGDTVLVRLGLSGVEFRSPARPADPEQVLAEVARILAGAHG